MAIDQSITVDYGEYRRLLDALGSLDKAANREMRQEAEMIADQIMVPAIKAAITSHAGNYAPKLNATIKTKQDRLPGVRVGNSTKTSSRGTVLNSRTAGGRGAFSGGATTNMIRFGTIKGQSTFRDQVNRNCGRKAFVQAGQIPPTQLTPNPRSQLGQGPRKI
jgi:hypothetical protein